MQVLVIGATRGTGRLVVDQLLAAGHEVRATVRQAGQAEELAAAGATTVHADLEGDLADAFDGIDAVMFCAGSGSKTGPDATLRVDLHGAVRTVDACLAAGVSRYVMLSSMAADDPMRGSEGIRHYLAAKHAADRILLGSGLDATVVRPGGLTDEPPTGAVEVGVPALDHRGQISRADVASVMVACLEQGAGRGVAFEVLSGDQPIADAVAGLGA